MFLKLHQDTTATANYVDDHFIERLWIKNIGK